MSPAPPKRRRDGLERRESILDAALRCFEREGLLGVGIEAIRREAGASPSSVYNLFPDIEGIILALLVQVFEQLFEHITQRVVQTRTARAGIHALVEAHIEWVAANATRARFMYQATSLEQAGLRANSRQALATRKSTQLEPLLAHFQPFVARGELPDWPPSLLDVVVLGVTHEALRRWLAGASEFHPNELRQMLPGLAWHSLRGALSKRSPSDGTSRTRKPRGVP